MEFKPEKKYYENISYWSNNNYNGMNNIYDFSTNENYKQMNFLKNTTGATVLGNYSNQTYDSASNINNYDTCGATVLGNRCSQNFGIATNIDDFDHENITIIYARMMIKKTKNNMSNYKSLKSVNKIFTTKIPPYLNNYTRDIY